MGFSRSATHVATAIIKFSSPEGFVLGLEGSWGAGKSSFINLIWKTLEADQSAPVCARYSPWLINSRAALLEELFDEIGRAALKISSVPDLDVDSHPTLPKKIWELPKMWLASHRNRQGLSKKLRLFGKHLSRAGKVGSLAEIFGLPGAGIVGKATTTVGTLFSSFGKMSLEKQKENLELELRALSRKIVIFVDDIDRLEPAEACEVIRLVRAVADFPNIVYLLSYSRKILAQSLVAGLSIDDGESYIEKIVQVTFSVPRPEDFDLRRLFRSELENLFPNFFADSYQHDVREKLSRLDKVIDIEGARTLSTPRDIARAINSLRLSAGPIIELIDLPDMVWLQLIRVRNVELYNWIESYLHNLSAVVGGAHIPPDRIARQLNELSSLFEEEKDDRDRRMHELENFLPGLDQELSQPGREWVWKLFQNLQRDTLSQFIINRRLGSTQHFRLYFAFSQPVGALSDSEFEEFIFLAGTNTQLAIQALVTYANRRRPQGGVWAETIIDRLSGRGAESVTIDAVPGILVSLANAMDAAAINIGRGDWGTYWIWNSAKSVLKSLLPRIEDNIRSQLLNEMFLLGSAIGWLSDLMRADVYSHGRRGDRVDVNDQLFRDQELDVITKHLCMRYRASTLEQLSASPDFVSILFAWQQSGGDYLLQLEEWITAKTQTDEDFLHFLESLRTWSSINGAVRYTIKHDVLKAFFDVAVVLDRLAILMNSSIDDLRRRAERIKSDIDHD